MFERYCVSCHLRLSDIKKQIHEEGHVFFCSNCDASCFYDDKIRELYGFVVGAWVIETIDTKEGFIQIDEETGEHKDAASINYYDGDRMKTFNFLPSEW